MKMFGRKAAGREESRPALEFRRARFAGGAVGDVPLNYEGQMRALYLRNAIAQRAVRMIADAVGDAPLSAAPEVLALVQARSAGQALTATVAGHLLLHGIRRSGSIVSGWRRWRCARRVSKESFRRIMACVGVMRRGWRRGSMRAGWCVAMHRARVIWCCSRVGRRSFTWPCLCPVGSSMPMRAFAAWSSDRACRPG